MISPKKQRFIDYIRSFTSENGRPPTFVEIMKGLSFSSLGTVNWYIVELEKEGIIKRVKGHNGKRALSLLEEKIDNQLPLLGLVAAGMPIENFDHYEMIDVPQQFHNKADYVLRVDGDSMRDDGILNGDYVILKKVQVARPGDTVVALINGEATLKQYYLGSNGVELHPKNNNYSIIHVNPDDDLHIQGLVVGIVREYN